MINTKKKIAEIVTTAKELGKNGHFYNEEVRCLIEDLAFLDLSELREEALPAEGEKFWPEQIVEVRGFENRGKSWALGKYIRKEQDGLHCVALNQVGGNGTNYSYYHQCRPAPNVQQWRPIPDDCMEQPEWLRDTDSGKLRFASGEEALFGNRWNKLSPPHLPWHMDLVDMGRIVSVMVDVPFTGEG